MPVESQGLGRSSRITREERDEVLLNKFGREIVRGGANNTVVRALYRRGEEGLE